MKFLILRDATRLPRDRVILHEREEQFFKTTGRSKVSYSLAAEVHTEDYDRSNKFPIMRNGWSVQYNPSPVYSSPKGYYYKVRKKIYLTEQETEEMLAFIKEAEDYLEKNVENLYGA
jgi:hypothetical protein